MKKFGVGWPLAALVLLVGACATGPSPSETARQQQEQQQQQRQQEEARRAEAERKAALERERERTARPGARTYRIIGVGDIMMGSDHPKPRLDDRLTRDVALEGIIGGDLVNLFQSGDVVFGNLEGTIHDLPGPSKECRNPDVCYVFRSPPHYADILARLGFNVVSLANNHAGDFLEEGRRATAANLDRVGIRYGGVQTPGLQSSILTLDDGTRVGFVAFAPNRGTLSINNISGAVQRVRALSGQTDMVVVSFHGGAEGGEAATIVPREMEIFLGEHRGDVYGFAHAVVDAGADVVFGHGPHVPRAVEVYKGRFIAYSLGNFWTYGRFNLSGYRGVAPIADLRVRRDGTLVSAQLHSVRQVSRGIPVLDPQNRALRAVEAFTRRDFPESQLIFLADGRITGPEFEVAEKQVSELTK